MSWTFRVAVSLMLSACGANSAEPPRAATLTAREPAPRAPSADISPVSSKGALGAASANFPEPLADKAAKSEPRSTLRDADHEAFASAADAGADAGEDSTRNVKYIVNPEGMRVEVEGVSFAPKAEAVKGAAGYSLKVRVEVRAKDDKAHSLLAPTGAELAFAGKLTRKGATEGEKFGDKREGEREVIVKGNKAAILTRSWPANGAKPLSAGDELELLVGIWGLGDDKASRRPLRKFCKISVKFDKPQPKVSITPPPGVTR